MLKLFEHSAEFLESICLAVTASTDTVQTSTIQIFEQDEVLHNAAEQGLFVLLIVNSVIRG
jgi:hypothetical protein